MKIITFEQDKMQIYSRGINESPDNKVTETKNFELDMFYIAHNNGVDYIQMDTTELMFFMQFIYSIDTFDLFADTDFQGVLNEVTDIYFSVEFNGVRELKPFKYSDYKNEDHVITSISDLMVCYDSGVFKDGLNINRIKSL